MTRLIVLLAFLLAPAVAGAQSAPTTTAPVYPLMPWGMRTAIENGNYVRDFWVPPYTVTVDTIMPVPAEQPDPASATEPAEPPAATDSPPQYQVWRQSVVVPGYWVRQTTAGNFYPQRWTLEQVAPGSYRWRLLPAELRPSR
jgi:hypothetical protein